MCFSVVVEKYNHSQGTNPTTSEFTTITPGRLERFFSKEKSIICFQNAPDYSRRCKALQRWRSNYRRIGSSTQTAPQCCRLLQQGPILRSLFTTPRVAWCVLKTKNFLFTLKKCSSQLQRWRCSCKLSKVVGLAPGHLYRRRSFRCYKLYFKCLFNAF
jgi:hypothetical protein